MAGACVVGALGCGSQPAHHESGAAGSDAGIPTLEEESVATASAPSWTTDLTTTLWRTTVAPLCATDGAGASVWSEPSAVYVMSSPSSAGLGGTITVYENSGPGWVRWSSWSRHDVERHLSGITGRTVWDFGSQDCGLYDISPVRESCAWSSSRINAVHVLRPELALAVNDHDLLLFDGNGWTEFGPPLPLLSTDWATGVWTSDDRAVVTSNDGRVIEQTGGSTIRAYDVSRSATAVWGHAERTWVGTSSGEIWESNGGAYQKVWTVPEVGECAAIRGMWGADDGQLFVFTRGGLWRIHDQSVAWLANLECGASVELTGIWGNSPSEVFLSVLRHGDACAGVGVVWFDGHTLRPL